MAIRLVIKGLLILLINMLMYGCQSTDQKTQTDEASPDSLELSLEASDEVFLQSTKSLLYNMFLPCEMVYLFEKTDHEFNPDLINPLDNTTNYNTTTKKSLNIGVMGVDMGYLNMNDQTKGIKDYALAIRDLAKSLGIPEEHVSRGIDYVGNYQMSEDSLFKITCELFEIADSYLHQNRRESTAALIVVGGWIEAMYISLNLYDSANDEVMQKIGRQKYSLNSMITLMNMYQNDPHVMHYLVMLRSLKKIYDNIELFYEDQKDVEIDTVKKHISTRNAQVNITIEQYKDIKILVNKIRKHIIN
jgi:hypothetical protein